MLVVLHLEQLFHIGITSFDQFFNLVLHQLQLELAVLYVFFGVLESELRFLKGRNRLKLLLYLVDGYWLSTGRPVLWLLIHELDRGCGASPLLVVYG